jgi:hypothetical protein
MEVKPCENKSFSNPINSKIIPQENSCTIYQLVYDIIMRDHINSTQKLFEMPGLLSGSESFGLDEGPRNLTVASSMLEHGRKTLFENDKCWIILTGTSDGWIGLISKANKKLYYFVKYESMSLPLVGGTATQVELWRHRAVSEYYPNITQYIFFDVLLPKFGAVMSDTLQTVAGMDFWIRMLGFALNKNMKIEMADFVADTVEHFDGGNLENWLSKVDPWGTGQVHKKRRLIILS